MPAKTLPWFTYSGVIEDLGLFLRKRVPVGHRDIVVFARKLTVNSDIALPTTYNHEPFELTLVCKVLEIQPKRVDVAGIAEIFDNFVIDLSGQHAADMFSFQETIEGEAWQGKGGCHGGSISIFCEKKVGDGLLNINVSGGKGGKGQDGYMGQPGKHGQAGINGENGGVGGRGGSGGDAGKIKIVSSKCSAKDIVHRVFVDGGSAGSGGNKGKGGVGTPSGKDGKDGKDGPGGTTGPSFTPVVAQVSDAVLNQSLPITACYLQRALNSEKLQLLRAKHSAVDTALLEAEENLSWIKQVAEQCAYDLIDRHCGKLIEICKQQFQPIARTIEFHTSHFNSVFDEVRSLVDKTASIHPQQLLTDMQADEALFGRLKNVQMFKNLHSKFEQNVTRLTSAKELAGALSEPLAVHPQLESALAVPSSTHIMQHIVHSAKKEPIIADVIKRGRSTSTSTASTATGDTATTSDVESIFTESTALELEELETEIGSADFLSLEGGSLISEGIGESILTGVGEGIAIEGAVEGAVATTEAGLVAATLPADIVFPPLLVAEVVVGAIVFAAVEIISALFESHAAAVARYEAAVRTRVQMENQNRLRLRHDEKEQEKKREKRKRKEKERSESGLYVGVLDKCEPVEGSGRSLLVATFDCIHLEFTTESGGEEGKVESKEVDLEHLDSTQEEELAVQLLQHRSPSSILPTFIVTATLTEATVMERSLGRWFQFETSFEGGSRAEAIEIAPLISFDLGKVLRLASAVTGGSMPVTVSKVKVLSERLETKIVSELGLFASSGVGSIVDELVPRMIQQAKIAGEKGKGKASEVKKEKHSSKSKTPGAKKTPPPSKKEMTAVKVARDEPDLGLNVVSRIVVQNVLQGNCIIFYDGDKVKLVVDFGYSGEPVSRLTIEQDIALSPVLVLSHWDIDHYRLLANYPILAATKNIIVPSFGSQRGPTARRCSESAQITAGLNNYHAYGAGNAVTHQQIVHNSLPENVTLRMTQVPQVPQEFHRSKNNYGAITACAFNQQTGRKLLLPGDASYSYVAPDHKQGLTHMLATHHGSTKSILRDTGQANSIPRPIQGVAGSLYFSYGPNNQYGHSIITAGPYYEAKGWTTMLTTEQFPGGIVITLT